MTLRLTLITLLFSAITTLSFAQEKIPLWPDEEMPNSKGLAIQDSVQHERIYQLKDPHMYAFFPSEDDNKGSAAVIFPGGGYHHITYVLSGTQLAKWFNVMGMSAFVVNYRLPFSKDVKQRGIAPLQDAQRAMRLVRANADKWGIDPDKIGVMGTSAGGHLASQLGTLQHLDASAIGDSLDQYSYDPDFMILISPVITMGKFTHEGSRDNLLGENPSEELIRQYSTELQVNENTPPTFLAGAFNDSAVHPKNSLLFYQALLEQGVSTSFHVFPQGRHSVNLRNNPGSTGLWTELAEEWLKEMGFLPGLGQE